MPGKQIIVLFSVQIVPPSYHAQIDFMNRICDVRCTFQLKLSRLNYVPTQCNVTH